MYSCPDCDCVSMSCKRNDISRLRKIVEVFGECGRGFLDIIKVGILLIKVSLYVKNGVN
jgi:hypothetical protein